MKKVFFFCKFFFAACFVFYSISPLITSAPEKILLLQKTSLKNPITLFYIDFLLSGFRDYASEQQNSDETRFILLKIRATLRTISKPQGMRTTEFFSAFLPEHDGSSLFVKLRYRLPEGRLFLPMNNQFQSSGPSPPESQMYERT